MPLTFADSVTTSRVKWLWPGYIPFSAVTVLDGDPGIGKSTVLIDIAARISCSATLPGGKVHPPMGTVLLMVEDLEGITIVPRLVNAGAALGLVGLRQNYTNDREQPIPPSFPSDIPKLKQDIIDARAGLVVIDPIMACLDPDINSNNDQQVRRALMPLAGLAEETGAAIVLLRHLNKGSGQAALYRGGGSIGFVGVARSALMIARDPDDPARLVLVSTKSNLGPQPPALTYALKGCDNGAARIEWTGRSDHDAASLMQQETTGERGAHAAACEFLNDILGDHLPMLAKELWRHVSDAGHARQTVLKAAKTLGVVMEKAKTQNGAYSWTLPREVSTPPPAPDRSDTSPTSDTSDRSHQTSIYPIYPIYPKNPLPGEPDTSPPPLDSIPVASHSGRGFTCAVCGGPMFGHEGQPLVCRPCRAGRAASAD